MKGHTIRTREPLQSGQPGHLTRTTQTTTKRNPHKKAIISVETPFCSIDWIVDRLMRSETQQHRSCVKRHVELAPKQMLSRICRCSAGSQGAICHASTSPFVSATVVAHAPSARRSSGRGLQSLRLVQTVDPHRGFQCFRACNGVPSDVCMYNRDIAPAMSHTAKHSSTAGIFFQQTHILRRERTHDTYA